MDYNYNGYDRGYTEPAMTSADYMNRTYRWMAVGLLITFAAAFVTAATPLLYVVNSLYLVFTIAELVLVYVLSSRVQNMSMVAGAAEGSSTMQTLTEAMKGSFETMVSDSMSMIAMLVPIVLPLVGAGLVVAYGIKTFKRVTAKA